MEFSSSQLDHVSRDWSKIAGEHIVVEQVDGAFYAVGSELGILRLFYHYRETFRHTNKAAAAMSKNLKTWYFRLVPM